MKKLFYTLVFICLGSFILGGLFLYFTEESDPVYQMHSASWIGEAGYYGRLHRDGSYTFYDKNGNPIVSVPAAKAERLH